MAVRGGIFMPIFFIIAIFALAGFTTTIIAQDAAAENIAAPVEASEAVAAVPQEADAAPEEAPEAVEEVPAAEEVAVVEEVAVDPVPAEDAPVETVAEVEEKAPVEEVEEAEEAPIEVEAAPEEEAPVAEDAPAPALDEVAVDPVPEETAEDAPVEVADTVEEVAPAAEEAPAVEEVAVDPVPLAKGGEEEFVSAEPVDIAIDEVAAAESAEVLEAEEAVAPEVLESIETYAIPLDPLTKLVLAEGDAFTLTCYALNEDYKTYDPLLKWRASPNDQFLNIFFGTRSRPGIPGDIESSVTAVQEGHLYHYNFHAAAGSFSGEYECDYTVNEQDVIYHVIVLQKDSITCPSGGSFEDQGKISEVSCSVVYDGFFPDGFVPQPTIQLAGEDVQSTSSFLSEDNKINIVAENIFVVRILNGATFKCVFPVTSASLALTCESPPLTVLWEPGKTHLKAPTSLVKDLPQDVVCSVDDLGNPPTEIELYVVGNPEVKAVQEGGVATLSYTETRQLTSVQFVCRTGAVDSELTQTADVFYGPEAVTSLSTDTAVMVENSLFSWECFPTPSNPPAEMEYLICDDPSDGATCSKIENSKELHAMRAWQHKYLICTATNAQTLREVASIPHKVDVHHPPRFLGARSENVISVREGEPFTLDCHHEANPEIISYEWEKEVFDEEDLAILRRKRREEAVEGSPTPCHADEEVVDEEAPAARVAEEEAAVEIVIEDVTAEPLEPEHVVEEVEASAEEAEPIEASAEVEAPVEASAEVAAPEEAAASEEVAAPEEATALAEVAAPEEAVVSAEENVVEVVAAEEAAPVENAPVEEAPVAKEAAEEAPIEVVAEAPVVEEAAVEEAPAVEEAADDVVEAAPVVEEEVAAEDEGEEEGGLIAFIATMLPTTVEINTPRPLLPSVDLSSHNVTTFSVLAAEPKHFGSYICRAKNAIGDNLIRYQVKQDFSPTQAQLEEERKRLEAAKAAEAKRKAEEEAKKKPNSGELSRISPALVLAATSLSLLLFR